MNDVTCSSRASAGLGCTVIEYPGPTSKKAAPEPEQAPPAHKLDLLKHLPEGDFKQYVGDVALMCNISSNTSLLVGLGIVSSVACRVFGVQYQNGDVLPTGEYIICSGLPGDAKSRMLKAYQRPIFQAYKAAVKDYRKREAEFRESPENEGKKFKDPYPTRIFITDSTVEALEPVLAESGGYFALASAEQAVINTLTGASYGGEGRKNNNDLPLKGFNGEYHASSRATRSGYSGDVVGSITCFAQPAAIETILVRSEGSGLAERGLFAHEPTQQGTRDHTRQHYPQEFSQNVYNRIVEGLAGQAIGQPQDFEDLPAYRISSSDWRKIYLFRNEIEPHLADGGKYSTATMRGIAAKVDMHIMKIAALLAYLYGHYTDEIPSQLISVGEIPSQFIDAAIGIMQDMLDNTLNLLFSVGMIGFNAEEHQIIDYLGGKKGATRRQVQEAKKKVKPFIETQSPYGAIGKTIDRLIQKGVVSETSEFDSNGKECKTLRLIA